MPFGRLQDPIDESAYDYCFGLIEGRLELDHLLELFLEDEGEVGVVGQRRLVTDWLLLHLQRPNSTWRQRFITVRDAIAKRPGLLTSPRYENEDVLRVLAGFLEIEASIHDALTDTSVLQRIVDEEGIDIGRVEAIERISAQGSINHAFHVRTDRGDHFLRYTSALGGDCFLRFDPKETLFRHVLGETTFAKTLGPTAVTRTIYPTLERAEANHRSDEGDVLHRRIAQRILVQPSYSDDYFRVQDYADNGEDLRWLVRTYARINAMVHVGTAGANSALGVSTWRRMPPASAEFIADHREHYRYTSEEEYRHWLYDVNWVSYMVDSLTRNPHKSWPDTDTEIIDRYRVARERIRQRGHSIEDLWWDCLRDCLDFWRWGAVLTGPDIKPSNSFYRADDGHIRLFDFDYFAFFDPAYHIGQQLYTVLRFGTKEEERYDVDFLVGLVELFLEEYHRELGRGFRKAGIEPPERFDSPQFRKVALIVGALSFFYVMVNDHREMELEEGQLEVVEELTATLLDLGVAR